VKRGFHNDRCHHANASARSYDVNTLTVAATAAATARFQQVFASAPRHENKESQSSARRARADGIS